jgi:hypothetical protein
MIAKDFLNILVEVKYLTNKQAKEQLSQYFAILTKIHIFSSFICVHIKELNYRKVSKKVLMAPCSNYFGVK